MNLSSSKNRRALAGMWPLAVAAAMIAYAVALLLMVASDIAATTAILR